MQKISIHESAVPAEHHPDRWSKDLIGGPEVPTTSGFSLGVAEYHAAEFGELQVHTDQEEVYVVSGVGQMRIGDEVHEVGPGSTFRLPPGTRHATRRTGAAPVRVVYAHARAEAGKPPFESEMSVSIHAAQEFNPPRTHDDHEALFVVAGTGEVRVGAQVVRATPGTAIYIPPGTPHSTRSTGSDPVRTLYAHGAV